MRKIIAAALIAVTVSGCAGLSQKLEVATGIYRKVTETTVPASVVIPTANAFDILKIGAANYGRYCIEKQMQPAICSADTRRIVIRSVRAGTKARNQMEASVEQGVPALSSIYNVLVAAVTDLQITPAASANFTGGQ